MQNNKRSNEETMRKHSRLYPNLGKSQEQQYTSQRNYNESKDLNSKADKHCHRHNKGRFSNSTNARNQLNFGDKRHNSNSNFGIQK